MTQHMILRDITGRRMRVGDKWRTACGRTVESGRATSWQQTDCRACRRSLAWWKASEQ